MLEEWYYLFLSFDWEDEEKIRYKFVTDGIDLDKAGIVEMDKSLVKINHNSFGQLIKQMREEGFREIKPISKELINDNEYFSLIAVHFILEYYDKLNRFPYETGFINLLKPDEFLNNKKLIEELTERLRKNEEMGKDRK